MSYIYVIDTPLLLELKQFTICASMPRKSAKAIKSGKDLFKMLPKEASKGMSYFKRAKTVIDKTNKARGKTVVYNSNNASTVRTIFPTDNVRSTQNI